MIERIPSRKVVTIVVVLVLISSVVYAAAPLFTAGSGVEYEAGSGLLVISATDHSVDEDNPFPDSNTVEVSNVSFNATGASNLTVDQFEGTFTNLSSMDVEPANVTINASDKQAVTIGGNMTKLEFRDMQLDETTDFVYSADDPATITVTNLPANTEVTAGTPQTNELDTTTTDGNGDATFELSSATNQDVLLFEASAPTVDNNSASPSGGETIHDDDVTFSIDVNDSDFAKSYGDNVSVTFVVNGTDQTTVDLQSNGTASTTLGGIQDGDHTWHVDVTDEYGKTTTSETFQFTVDHRPATFNSSTASPTGDLDSDPTELKINISDPDFATDADESLTVTFHQDGSQIDSQTLNSNGSVSTSINPTGGEHTWHVEVTDSAGVDSSSQDFTYRVPANLTIRNATQPSQIINQSSAEVKFFADDTVITRTTSNGKINLTGLPVDQKMVITVDSSNFHKRATIIDSIYEQDNIFLLNKTSEPSVEIEFTNEDQTGDFSPDNSELIVLRPITLNGSTEFRRVAGDTFGVGGIVVDLEENIRYRLRVRNDDGDIRELGTYEPTISETQPLRLGERRFQFTPDGKTYKYGGSLNESGDLRFVTFSYSDGDDDTTNLNVTIYERNNKSNVVYQNVFAGPVGNVSVSQNVTDYPNGTEWAVNWSADHAESGKIGAQFVVGKSSAQPGVDLAADWKHRIAIMFTFGFAFLFGGRVNARAGLISIPMLAGIFWYMNWMPPEISGLIVAVAMTLGIIVYAQAQRGF